MAKSLPWFPLYVDDFLLDEKTRSMSFQELGIYASLLCWQWREGSLPARFRDVATMIGATQANERKALQRVLAIAFKDDGTGYRVVNEKLERVRSQQMARSNKASAASRGGHEGDERFVYALRVSVTPSVSAAAPEVRIKIGWSRNPAARVVSVRRDLGPGATAVLLGSKPASIALERRAHVDLSDFKVTGEWFRDCPQVLEWLVDVGIVHPDGNPGGNTNGDTAVRAGRERRRIRLEIEKSLSAHAGKATA